MHAGADTTRMELHTSEFRGRFTVGQGRGGRTRGNKEREGREFSANSGSLACGRAWEVSNLGRRRARRAAGGGGGGLVKKSPSHFAPSRSSFVIHPADGVGAPRARAQLGLGGRERSGDGSAFLGRLRLLHLGRFALGGSGRQGLGCRGRAASPPDGTLSTHASSTSVDGVDDDADEPDDVAPPARAAEGPRASDPLDAAGAPGDRRFHRGCVGGRGDVERGRGLQRCRRAHGDQRGAHGVLIIRVPPTSCFVQPGQGARARWNLSFVGAHSCAREIRWPSFFASF